MSSYLRFSWWAAACLALMSAPSSIRAQDTNASLDSPPATNAATTNFLDHPGSPLSLNPPAPQGAGSEATAQSDSEIIVSVKPADEVERLADHLLVVYNQNDPDSKMLADYYASARNIPPERVLGIPCSSKEEINHDEFENTIRQPILFYLMQKNWIDRKGVQVQFGARSFRVLAATRNDIWSIVLMRGVPLKIAPDPTDDDVMENDSFFKNNGVTMDPGILAFLKSNAAAVDSELALLPVFGFPRGGFVPNVFYDVHANGLRRVGSDLAKNLVLVARLDGPTPAQVKRMIDDSLYAEKNRLAGLAVIDTQGITDPKNGFFGGDQWLRNARDMLIRDGWVVKFDDNPAVLPATDPLNQVALYMGWYTDKATGPWVTAPDRFVRGAIAYHLHSFSGNTVRSETDNWVGPLIAHGAAASMGTVYEPIMGWTPHEDIFTKRLLDGDYFVEAAYASQLGLGWMTTVVGDPLYRPFRQPIDSVLPAPGAPHTDHDDWLFLQLVRREILNQQVEMTADRFRETIEVPGVGPVAEEGLGDLLVTLRDPEPGYTAEQAYKKAAAGYTLPIDRIRIGIKLNNYYKSHNQAALAQAQFEMLRQLFPEDAARFGLGPPPASASPTPPPIAASLPSPVPQKNTPQPAPALVTPPTPPTPPKPLVPQFPHPASEPE